MKKQRPYNLLFLLLLFGTVSRAQVSNLEAGIISTLAGKGNTAPGFSGDGGPSMNSLLNSPSGVAVDNSGNVYISDGLNHRIRKVTKATRVITTIAGTGAAGFSGDGGAASAATLNHPTEICIDLGGAALYFFDSLNYRVRRIDLTTGIISTVAGNGTQGYNGQTMPAGNAGLSGVSGITILYQSLLFISLGSSARICQIDLNTGNIFTVAGTGVAGFSGDGGPAANAAFNYPAGLTVDAYGIIYVADCNNHRVRRIDTTGIISTVAGAGVAGFSGDTGPALSASLNCPQSVAVTNAGMMYIADRGNHRIRQVYMKTGKIYTIAGSGVAGYGGDGSFANTPCAKLFTPLCVRFRNDTLYIADFSNNCIRRVERTLQAFINVQLGPPVDTIAYCSGVFTMSYTWSSTILSSLVSLLAIEYQVNGNAVGNIGTTLLYSPVAGDIVTATFLFGTNCGNITIVSNPVKVVTPPQVSPAITLTAAPYDSCGNSVAVSFTATLVDEGTNPVCRCRSKDGRFSLTTTSHTPAFTVSASDGDEFYCLLTSSEKCKPRPTEMSNSIVIRLYPKVTPAVTITAGSTTACAGQSVVFTATATNGGNAPVYQWQVNSVNAGTGPSFTSAALADGDTVSCVLAADPTLRCLTSPTVRSNKIIMKIESGSVNASISITASANNVCAGSPVTFTANAQSGGSSVSYQWRVNGVPVGVNRRVYVSDSLKNGDAVFCTISAAGSGCFTPVLSNVIVMAVRPSPIIVLMADSTTISPGGSAKLTAQLTGNLVSYAWSPAGLLTNPLSLAPVTKPLTASTLFVITATNAEGCTATAQILIRVPVPFLMPSAFTPNGDGKNDVFGIPAGVPLTLRQFSIYNRWGGKVFATADAAKGWDGRVSGLPQATGVYVYVIKSVYGGKEVVVKGTFVLIR